MKIEIPRKPRNLFVATFIGSTAMNLLRGIVETAGSKPIVNTGKPAISVPGRLATLFKKGHQVTLGLRPTELAQVPRGTKSGYEAKLEFAEYLGTEALLDLRIKGIKITAQVPAHQRPKDGEHVQVGFDLTQRHVFGASSGLAL